MSSAEGDPEPQVKYRHAAPEGEELEQWKSSVLAMIDKRIDLYPLPPSNALPAKISRAVLSLLARMKRFLTSLLRLLRSKAASIYWNRALEQEQPSRILDPDRVVTAVEKVGHVPELVENIIRFADAETQIHAAWNVSSLWRNTVTHVVATSDLFRQSQLSKAVEIHGPLDLDVTSILPEPSAEDFQKFENELLLLQELNESLEYAPAQIWYGIYTPYWPAHIYASKVLPSRQRDLYDKIRRPFGLRWRSNRWYDFTQFKMNPYLQAVFSQQLSESVGNYEFQLRSLHQSNNLVFGTVPHLQPLIDLMGSMQLTEPPVKAIELCVQVPFAHPARPGPSEHPLSCNDKMHTAIHVLNENGITCAQLLDALGECAESVMVHWRLSARQFRGDVLKLEHYTDGIWRLRGRPTIHVTLSSTYSCENKFRSGTMQVPSIIDRQLEWIPMELVRTMEHVEIRDGRVRRYPADLGH